MADVRARPDRAAIDVPVYRPFPARVVRREALGPSFVRLTFSSDELGGFGYAGCDQRIKVLLPAPGRTLTDLPYGSDWYESWRTLPDEIRPVKRTYTVRAFRPQQREVDVDFVLHGLSAGRDDLVEHGTAGPVSTWAASARPGDEVALLGPDRDGSGRLWGVEWAPPDTATTLLLAGDETAVPAIGAILESLPTGARILVCAEVPDEADAQPWSVAEHVEVRWLVRRRGGSTARRGELLEGAVRDWLTGLAREHQSTPPATDESDDPAEHAAEDVPVWDIPDREPVGDAPYVWLAGEAGVMKTLRSLARHEFQLPKTAVACMGYWREGAAEG